MPRKPRVEFEGAVYHVVSRGNRQGAIYLDDKDCGIFLDTLDEACKRTGWRIHAYVLMGNHYHLLLETPHANLVAGMKWLQGTYTQRFNARHKAWGHLLQGRYKALLVDSGNGHYFSTVSSYIHLNPARAKRFDFQNGKLSDYRWSSYPLYFDAAKRPEWLETARVLNSFGLSADRTGLAAYKKQMQKRVLEIALSEQPWAIDEQWDHIRRGWCFGTDEFKDQMLERIDLSSGQRDSFSGDEVGAHDELDAERLLIAGMKALEVREDDIPQLRKGAEEKALLAWLVRKNTAVSNAWIAGRLQMGRADCLSRYPRLIEESQDKRIQQLKTKLVKITRLRD
jgi:REP element-mobilizing transposase RayT